MKISRALSDSLDSPITLLEFDKAMEETKSKTASGPDGIGNGFLKKFWVWFRVPLLKYTNFCLDRGSLSQSFLTAAIKLIRKKGDVTQIKNWRPISLLNCTYKIISKMVNNRLKKVTENINLRAPKGFTKAR